MSKLGSIYRDRSAIEIINDGKGIQSVPGQSVGLGWSEKVSLRK